MKYLLLGLSLSLFSMFVSFVIGDIKLVITITSVTGLFFIGIALLLSGALVSGDRMRANLATESRESRNRRHNTSFRAILIATPNIMVAFLFYYFLSK